MGAMTATAPWSLADHIKQRQAGVDCGSLPTRAPRTAGPTIAEAMTIAREVEITRFGAPGRCPTCDAPGYVRAVDMRSRATYSSCQACGTKWTAIERRRTPRS